MSWIAISTLCTIAGLLLTIFTTAIVWLFRHIIPAFRHGGTFLRNLMGVPEDRKTGQVCVPSIFERLDSQDKVLHEQNAVLQGIVHQVQAAVQQVANSHVTNLRDDVDEVIGKVDSLHDKVDNLQTQSTTTVNVNPPGGPS